MATMKDIAKLAGVGLGTVSRVINNEPGVKPATRAAVERVIRELRYTPNEVARSFKMSSSRLVGLMIPTVWHPFFAELTFHVENELHHLDYKLLLCNSETNMQKEMQYVDMLKRNQVAGIIIISYHDFYNSMQIDFPIVTIERYISKTIPHVASNNYQGGVLATEALLRSGCKKLAYVGGGSRIETSATRRRDAFVDTARLHGIPYTVIEEDLPLNAEERLAGRFFLECPETDGVFASTDMFASALLQNARLHNRRVPEELQIVGYDGIKITEETPLRLSTIRQPLKEIAKASVDLLVRSIAGEEVEKEVILPVTYHRGFTTLA